MDVVEGINDTLKEHISFNAWAITYVLSVVTLAALFTCVHQYLGANPRSNIVCGKTMVILGSGGHTREMLNLCNVLRRSFSPKIYVATDSDELSLTKARQLEEGQVFSTEPEPSFTSIIRIRDVGQSFLSALVGRAPRAFYQSARLLYIEKPNVLLCNGPGVSVPFCFAAIVFNVCQLGFVYKKLRLTDIKIVFVESICRVKSLSLTGRIMIRISDRFVVQWKDLEDFCRDKYPNADVVYLGRVS